MPMPKPSAPASRQTLLRRLRCVAALALPWLACAGSAHADQDLFDRLPPAIRSAKTIKLVGDSFAPYRIVGDDGKIPFWTLFAVYWIQSVGELCLSPIGLSMVTKLAPVRLVGLGMGGWFLSTGIGNNLSGIFASHSASRSAQRFFVFASKAAMSSWKRDSSWFRRSMKGDSACARCVAFCSLRYFRLRWSRRSLR